MAEEFTPIETQEQFDAAIKDRMDRITKKYEGYTSPADLNKIKAEYERQITDLTNDAAEKAKKYADYDKQIADRDAKLKSYETASVKTRIAHETGLPYELASRLSGETEDDIRKDAESLKSVLSSQTKPTVKTPLSDPEPEPKGGDAREALRKALREMKKEG